MFKSRNYKEGWEYWANRVWETCATSKQLGAMSEEVEEMLSNKLKEIALDKVYVWKQLKK